MRERKEPYRPRSDNKRAAEVYTDGVVRICTVTDKAVPGLLPRETLTPRLKLYYQERKLGVMRNYQAAQNLIKVERVIRVPAPAEPITSQDAAITEDGRHYRIDLVQVVAEVWPRSLDLTLVRYGPKTGTEEAI